MCSCIKYFHTDFAKTMSAVKSMCYSVTVWKVKAALKVKTTVYGQYILINL